MTVYYNKHKDKYTVRVRRVGRLIQAGSFDNEADAVALDASIEQNDTTVKPYSTEWFQQESKEQLKYFSSKSVKGGSRATY